MFGGGMLVLWLFLIGGVVAALGGINRLTGGVQQNSNRVEGGFSEETTPGEILRTRYASGELSREEYLEAKETLQR